MRILLSFVLFAVLSGTASALMLFQIELNNRLLGSVYLQQVSSADIQQYFFQPSFEQKMALARYHEAGVPILGVITWAHLAHFRPDKSVFAIDVNAGHVRTQEERHRGSNIYAYEHWISSVMYGTALLRHVMNYSEDDLKQNIYRPGLIELFNKLSAQGFPKTGECQFIHDLSLQPKPVNICFTGIHYEKLNTDTFHYLHWYSQLAFQRNTQRNSLLLSGQAIYKNGQLELIEHQFLQGYKITYRRNIPSLEAVQEIKKSSPVRSGKAVKQRQPSRDFHSQYSSLHNSGLGSMSSGGIQTNSATLFSIFPGQHDYGLGHVFVDY